MSAEKNRTGLRWRPHQIMNGDWASLVAGMIAGGGGGEKLVTKLVTKTLRARKKPLLVPRKRL